MMGNHCNDLCFTLKQTMNILWGEPNRSENGGDRSSSCKTALSLFKIESIQAVHKGTIVYFMMNDTLQRVYIGEVISEKDFTNLEFSTEILLTVSYFSFWLFWERLHVICM